MKSFIRKKLPLILIIAQAVLIIGILLYIVPGRYRLYDIVLYDASENVPANPLIGFAPPAEQTEDCAGTNLVFLTVSFSEWEPEEGVFDVDGLEEKYHIAEHREAGRHAVLRFVCDLPGEAGHRDIPEWLYRQTADGVEYTDESGSGYAPAYDNAVFTEAHAKALRALADWCLQDSFVAYVEVGSIGRGGDWSASTVRDPDQKKELSVPEKTLQIYAQQYAETFPQDCGICLLESEGQRLISYAGSWRDDLGDTGAADGLAVSDTVDDAEQDKEETAAEPAETVPPAGGSLTTAQSMETLIMTRLSETLQQIRENHAAFIGPVCPNAAEQSENGSEMILRNIGYCIYLSRLQTTVDFMKDELQLHLTFENIGEAPMYWDWPVNMFIYDDKGELLREEVLDLKLSQLMPGGSITTTGTVPYSDDLLRGYSVRLSITSPDGSEFITFAQKGVLPDTEGKHRVYIYKGKK